MWKIVGASKVSVIYIYIYILIYGGGRDMRNSIILTLFYNKNHDIYPYRII